MNIRQQLSLEQQFELQVFESQVQELSIDEAQGLLVELREAMMYQKSAFCEILRDSWGIGDDADISIGMMSEG